VTTEYKYNKIILGGRQVAEEGEEGEEAEE